MTNLVRAGLARIAKRTYAPLPTAYDGLFPSGTFLTAPKRAVTPSTHEAEPTSTKAQDRSA